MDRYGIILLFFLAQAMFGQENDSLAYHFKLDYDVPESPAFSILDANPNTIMRGSAAKELAINIANSFVTENTQASGVALDFNPYFVFGGRLDNVKEYWEKPAKRILANTQLSFASITSDAFPDDNLISLGLRITLFDALDLLFDKQLGNDIGRALIPTPDPAYPGQNNSHNMEIVDKPSLTEAYKSARERSLKKKGGAISVGLAIAQRAKGGALSRDSLVNYRNQAWLSGQYNFGNGHNLLGLAMFRNTFMDIGKAQGEVLLGVGYRHLGAMVNAGGELTYSSQKDFIELALHVEVQLVDNVIFVLSMGNGSEFIGNQNNRLVIKPTFRYNFSEPRKK